MRGYVSTYDPMGLPTVKCLRVNYQNWIKIRENATTLKAKRYAEGKAKLMQAKLDAILGDANENRV
ncbi:hypothetical protein LCGC14_1457740 [marine sediment metagenome]|uniref:Uncharacterized protein n=1 Tax=marine sediment metagenome TaxID=412755 RepID=A0A0F9K235_9ZZZZ